MEFLFLIVLGLVAGTLGGLLGIGGSVIMIPALLFFMPDTSVYLAQATAMTVNPAVAIGAAIKHHKHLNVSWQVALLVLPLSVVSIGVAAWFSNAVPGAWLEFAFGLFLIWVLWDQIQTLYSSNGINDECTLNGNVYTTTIPRASVTGGVTGVISGFLGIGGGLVRVPLLNSLCKLPMKKAIGTSSAIMFVTALVGATMKDVSLEYSHNQGGRAVVTALQIIPGAFLGGWIGAKLTKVLPTAIIRGIFALLVLLATYKLISNSIPNLW